MSRETLTVRGEERKPLGGRSWEQWAKAIDNKAMAWRIVSLGGGIAEVMAETGLGKSQAARLVQECPENWMTWRNDPP